MAMLRRVIKTGGTWDPEKLLGKLLEQGWTTQSSKPLSVISGALGRLVQTQQKDVEKVGHGQYRWRSHANGPRKLGATDASCAPRSAFSTKPRVDQVGPPSAQFPADTGLAEQHQVVEVGAPPGAWCVAATRAHGATEAIPISRTWSIANTTPKPVSNPRAHADHLR